MTDRAVTQRAGFSGSAKLVAALTLLSRVLGLVSDMVMVPIGGGALADRFWMAFSAPNLFRRLFGEGALAAALVPVFAEVTGAGDRRKARAVLANAAGLLAALLAALVVLVELTLLGAWAVLGGDWARLVLLQLTGLMLPFTFTVCLLALGSAALNCRGHFAYPAFAPAILNVALIVAGGFLAPALHRDETGGFFVIALGIPAAGVIQLAGVVWLLKRAGLAAGPTLRPVLPEVRRIVRLTAPMVIALIVLQLSAFTDPLLALLLTRTSGWPNLPLHDGVVRCLYAANRLYQLPMAVLAILVATVVFPPVSRCSARNDVRAMPDVISRALRLGAFLTIPAGVGLILLARPLVGLIFQRKGFTAFDADRTTLMLQMYCLGTWAYCWNHMLLRAFFARKDARTPLILSGLLAGANLLLVAGGVLTPLKGGAIALATAITSSAGSVLLIRAARRRWGRIGGRQLAVSVGRSLLASAIMGAVVYMRLRQLSGAGRLVVVLECVVTGAATFLLAAWALRAAELRELRGAAGALAETAPRPDRKTAHDRDPHV